MLSPAKNGRVVIADARALLDELKINAAGVDADLASIQADHGRVEDKNRTKKFKAMVLASGSTLMELPGVGPVLAARASGDTGDVTRFTDRTTSRTRTNDGGLWLADCGFPPDTVEMGDVSIQCRT